MGIRWRRSLGFFVWIGGSAALSLALGSGCGPDKSARAAGSDSGSAPVDSGAGGDSGGAAEGGASDGGAAGDGGGGGEPPEALVLGPVQACAAPRAGVTYTEHGAELGFLGRAVWADQHLGDSSLIVDDIDHDGDLDIVQGLAGSPLRVYWADAGAYTPEDLTPTAQSSRLRHVDVDGDGHADLLQFHPLVVWPGAADGLAAPAPFEGFGEPIRAFDAQPLDLNADGLLDYFIPGNSPEDDPEARRDRLVMGVAEGSPRLELLPGDEATGNAAQASALDWEGDGDLDVYVTNDMGAFYGGSQLWLNEGGTLAATSAAGCLPTLAGMAHAFGDYDRDGAEDIFVGATLEARLLRRLPDGTCIDFARALGADPLVARGRGTNPMIWSTAFFDHDNDGRLDLVHTEGDLYNGEDGLPRYDAPIDLMQQQPDGRFVDVGAAVGLARVGSHRAVVPEDLNGDGVLDLVVADVEDPLRLYLSAGCTAAAWLRVEAPEQTRVEVEAGGERWTAVARAEVSIGGFRRPLVHIGLGELAAIDRITLRPLVGAPVVIEGPIEPRRLIRWTP